MSRTTLYGVYKTKATAVNEYRNGWGSGPAIWQATWAGLLKRPGFMSLLGEDISEIMAVVDDESAPGELRRCLKWVSYDRDVVKVADAERLAADCRFVHVYIEEHSPDRVNHWAFIARDVEVLTQRKDRRLRGIGIAATSVCDPWTGWRP